MKHQEHSQHADAGLPRNMTNLLVVNATSMFLAIDCHLYTKSFHRNLCACQKRIVAHRKLYLQNRHFVIYNGKPETFS